MKGRYDVVLYNNKVHYHLTIKRNITILRGDSASGKSEFIRLLAQYNGSPKSSGISLICDRECIVLNEGNWKLYLETYRERIFFIDEGNDFLRTKEFADAVKGADNYFVIISRENFPNLPYSVDEIYGLREGKYREAKRVYNEMYRIYGNLPDPQQKPEIVITEDSNSGNEFFELLFPGKCISANGKSNIKRVLLEHMGESVLAVVDGAAFGPEMQDCMELTEVYPVSIFAPESFEFLILESGLIEAPMTVLEQTWDYADSVKYFSWEEFYTWYLSNISRNEVYQYSKRKLNNFFKTAGSIKRIGNVLPESLRC
jgi:hypothetical protein